MKTIFRRLGSLVLSLVMVLSFVPFGTLGIASAEDIVYTEVADEAALNAAIAEGKNPKLTAGFALTAAVTIPQGTTVTIDLNGQALQITCSPNYKDENNKTVYTPVIQVDGTLTVLDSSEGKTATISSIAEKSFGVSAGGILNLLGGTLTVTKTGRIDGIDTKGTVTIANATVITNTTTSNSFPVFMSGGKLTVNEGADLQAYSNATGNSANAIYCSNGEIVVNGGKLHGEQTNTSSAYGIQLTSGADKLVVNGGTITAHQKNTKNPRAIDASGGTVTINGGTVAATADGAGNPAALWIRGSASATINNGSFTSTGKSGVAYGILFESSKALTMNGGAVTVDNTAGSASGNGIYISSGRTANLKGGSITVNTAGGNASGVLATATATADATSLTITNINRSTVNFPADSKELTITTNSASGTAYGVNSEGGNINANSPKLTVSATTGFSATSGSTMKYAYAISTQGPIKVTAGSFNGYASNTKATKVQAFGLNNSRKTVKVTPEGGTEVSLYDYSTAEISGGSFYGSASAASGAGIMTNYTGGLTLSGTVQVSGTDYAVWNHNGPVEIKGGTYFTDGTYVIRVGDGAAGTAGNMTISGGTIKHSGEKPARVTGTKGAQLNIIGGKFVGDIGRGAVDVTAQLPEGYTQNYYGEVVEGTSSPKFAVSLNGTTTNYVSYWDMVSAVNTDATGNAKVTLLQDIYLGAAKAFTTSVAVDLNGHTWLQSNGTAIDVNKVGTANAVTRITNGTLINDYASVVIYVRAGAIQLDGVTAYSHTTMPVCYTAPDGTYAADNYVKNSNLLTNRFYTFSYRTTGTTGQTNMDVLFEDTNLINLYNGTADGAEIFYAASAATTGQYTIGKNVNMYTVKNVQDLAKQEPLKDNTCNVNPVAVEGYTIHGRADAASYADINAILTSLNSKADISIATSPSLYKWSTNHSFVNGSCTCGVTEGAVAKVGETSYEDLSDALEAATAGQTVTLLTNVKEDDLLVMNGTTLDLNGHTVTAESLTVYGNLVDGTSGGNALVAANSFHTSGTGFLPIYDKAAAGYRFYNYKLNELGYKSAGENTIKLGFRMTLDNASGYDLMTNAENSNLSAHINITLGGEYNTTMVYDLKAATLAAYGEAMAAGKTTWAIQLTVKGVDVLGENGTMTMAPTFASTSGMKVSGNGTTWTAATA